MKTQQSSRKRFLGTILLCNLFLSLTVVFFSPMEIVLLNRGEFYFPFNNVWGVQLLVALGAALVLSLLMMLLPPRAGQIAAAVSLGLGLAAYVQALFLNGKMVSLTGASMKLTDADKTTNLIIWGCIVLAVLLCVIFLGARRKKATNLLMKGVACALIVMQTVGLVSLIFADHSSDQEMETYLSVDGEFELSSGNNVIEFVLDSADGLAVREMLATYPELYDSLSGWVYYPNATSKHSRTYPSIPYMLTGAICHYDLPVTEYVEQAFDQSHYLKGLNQAGTDIRLFTWNPEIIAKSTQEYVANSSAYRYNRFENLNLPKLIENMMKIALYKSLPYQFKNQFRYNLVQVNMSSFTRQDLFFKDFSYMDPGFYSDLTKSSPISVTDKYAKAFRFYHLFGPHPGADWDENLDTVSEDESTDIWDLPYRARVLRGSYKMIEEYIRQMKELGIYDQSTIIITADHAISDDRETQRTLVRQTTACPVMMVKYAGSDLSQPLRISSAPVAHEDIFATVEKALSSGVTGTGSGRGLEDIAEAEDRDRYYYHTAFHTDESGEVAMREYIVSGDAEDLANWHLTGKWWDILYSQNAISDEKLTDTLEQH